MEEITSESEGIPSECEGGGGDFCDLGDGRKGTYEELRVSNIKRNHDKLVSLGLATEPSTTKSSKRKAPVPETSEPPEKRKSLRIIALNTSATNIVGEKEEAPTVLTCIFCSIKSPFDYKKAAALAWMNKHVENNAQCLVAQNGYQDSQRKKRKHRQQEEQDRSVLYVDDFLCCKNRLCKWKTAKTGRTLTDRQTLNGHYAGCEFKTLQMKRQHKGKHTGHGGGEDFVDNGQECEDEEEGDNRISVLQLGDDSISISTSYVDDVDRSPQAILDILKPLIDVMEGPSLSMAHQEASPQIASPLSQPCTDSAISLMEKSDKRIFIIQQNILALLANPTKMKKGKDVKIVLQVYKTGVDLGLSDSGGDKFLATLKAVHDRAAPIRAAPIRAAPVEDDGVGTGLHVHDIAAPIRAAPIRAAPVEDDGGVGTGLHKNWKSLRQAVEGDLFTIWKLHCKQIPLPKGLFPVVDLDGKPIKHLDTFHYHIWDQLAAAFLQIDVDEFFFKPNPIFSKASKDNPEQHRIYGPYSSGKLFGDICEATTYKFGPGAVSVCVGLFWDEAMAGKRHTACPLSMTIMNAFGDSYRTIFLGMCPVELAYTDHYLGKLLAKDKPHPPTKAGVKFALRYAKRQALLKYLHTVLLPLKLHDSTGFKLQIGQGKYFISRLLANIFSLMTWFIYFIQATKLVKSLRFFDSVT